MSVKYRQSATRRYAVLRGAIYGGVASVVGYLVTLGLVAVTESGDVTDYLLEGAGWVYFNAQFASLELSLGPSPDLEIGVESYNIVTGDTPSQVAAGIDSPAILYHLVPVLVFFAAGFLLVYHVGAHSFKEGALYGGSLALGAIVFAVAGSIVFSVDVSTFSLSPATDEGVIFAGILFPAIFGSIGGASSLLVGAEESSEFANL
jgi:hypothetical protein